MTYPQFVSALVSLISDLKRDIPADSRATEDDTTPSILLTVGVTDRNGSLSFGWQTGDNSFHGNSYGHQTCSAVSIYPWSNAVQLTEEIVNEVFDQFEQLA